MMFKTKRPEAYFDGNSDRVLLVIFVGAVSLAELTDLVHTELNCSYVLVTEISGGQQELMGNSGLALPERYQVPVPLKYSICQHTAAMDFPLVIDDTVFHPLLKGNFAHSELGIASYLGAPLHASNRRALGAICALEHRHRRRLPEDIELIKFAAKVADLLILSSSEREPQESVEAGQPDFSTRKI